jgi:hypothetical protein
MTMITNPRTLADDRWLHGNYDGLGKSGVQEAYDSARALALALIASGVMSGAAVLASL